MDHVPEQTALGAENIDILKTPYYHEITMKLESTEPQIGTKLQPHKIHGIQKVQDYTTEFTDNLSPTIIESATNLKKDDLSGEFLSAFHLEVDTQITTHSHIAESSQPNIELEKSIEIEAPIIPIESKTYTTIHTNSDHMPTYLDTVGLEMEDTNKVVIVLYINIFE